MARTSMAAPRETKYDRAASPQCDPDRARRPNTPLLPEG
jgi:hypothetical protein